MRWHLRVSGSHCNFGLRSNLIRHTIFWSSFLLGGNTHGQWHGCWGNKIHTWKVLRKQRMGGSSVGKKYNLLYELVIDGYNKEGFGQWKQEHFFNLFLRIIWQSWASIPILFLFTMTRLLKYYLCLLYNEEVLATFTLTFKYKLILRLWTYNFTHLLLVVLIYWPCLIHHFIAYIFTSRNYHSA